MYLPTIGHALAFIHTLDHPEMVGLNPEIAHDTMAGLDFAHGVAQALDAGKLFHIDLNAQKPGRYDQDHRFGSEDPKQAFFLVKLLEDAKWRGMRHFDSHAYRTEDEAGVWDFAAGSMRTYLILKDKAERFNADAEIQQLIADLKSRGGGSDKPVKFSAKRATELRNQTLDLPAIRRQGYAYERLDQLTMELLLGVR
jgi:xylose isomerase